MVQATTPTFILTLPNTVDLTIVQSMYFTLEQKSRRLTKSGDDLQIDGQDVIVALSQAETLAFGLGSARLQLNWTYDDGSRACSNIVEIEVDENLLKRVVV